MGKNDQYVIDNSLSLLFMTSLMFFVSIRVGCIARGFVQRACRLLQDAIDV